MSENRPPTTSQNATESEVGSPVTQDYSVGRDQSFNADDNDAMTASHPTPPLRRPRRWTMPIFLFVATMVSMTWAGIAAWNPMNVWELSLYEGSMFTIRQHVLANWESGLVFSLSLAAILGAHELGHYFVTKLYRIPSTLPLFIPFPIGPTGTCGAVILMDGFKADRKQIFDIGIAGPLAGLVFAIPIAWFGLLSENYPATTGSTIQFGQPLGISLLNMLANPTSPVSIDWVPNTSMNPLLMAAWVGLLVTGLNMIPISQLDGGHVLFGLLGRKSAIVSLGIYLACVVYVVFSSIKYGEPVFILMLILIPLMGIGHPPSRNDDVQLGWGRILLGAMALLIPVFCLPLRPIQLL
ncbi:site-2 protease family protein [Pirellulaceae bacterium SH449]